ncbi:MAG: sulfatase-like hydrolase/transferase [Candidatus Lokiarchaeota archaeon]|nr:sulfatase-like hydrolase/transferase [Candidatus Lokiarchaeota archaeon]
MPRPNVLLITTDQHHRSVLGINDPAVKTRNLDMLAREGMVLARAYCPNPTCTPSRASIVTGQYASQHGAWSLGTKLLEDVPTIGDELRKAGYRTALIGKSHFEPLRSSSEFKSLESYPILQDLDFWRGFHGPYYGFDYIELARNHTDEAHVGQHYAIWMEEKGYKDWRDHFLQPTGKRTYVDRLRDAPLWRIPEEFHYNKWIAEAANKKLEEYAREKQPFFLWASFLDPHGPRILPEPWHEMYDPAEIDVPGPAPGEHDKNPPHFRYAQQTPSSPNKFKRFFHKLMSLLNSVTVVKYYNDFRKHGLPIQGLHGVHPHLYDKAKLAREIAAYRGMVSLIDKYIGEILQQLDRLGLADNTIVVFTTDHGDFYGQHGLVTKGPFHYEDLLRLPFIVRYPGKVPAGKTSDALQSHVDIAPTLMSLLGLPVPAFMAGVDQSGVWTGTEGQARDHVLVEMHHSPALVHLKTLVDRRYKVTVYNEATHGELFDLQEDPGEKRNLWSDPEFAGLKGKMLFQLVQAELKKDMR